jgi:hypothetical protein
VPFFLGTKMKHFLVIFFIFQASCAQLLQGQQQPVKPLKNNMYYTSCSGAVENMASCNDKAQATCENGYKVVRKDENSTGTVRELVFECKK